MNCLKFVSCRQFWQGAALMAMLAGTNGLVEAQEMTPHQHRKVSFRALHPENGTAEAYNWSGYAIAGATSTSTGVTVTSVSASWTVPKGTCSGRTAQYAAFWIGIDGWYSDTVEQIGTDTDCSSGSPVYYAWYEFYPENSYYACPTSTGRQVAPCPLKTLSPGDVITASVVENKNGTFTATITATSGSTTIGTFSTTYTPNRQTGTPQLSSAEWIAEAPCCTNSGGTLPLADFGSVTFTNAMATVNGLNGTPEALITFPTSGTPESWSCTMINDTKGSTALMAQPSALGETTSPPDPTYFSVAWLSVGP